MKAFGRNGYVLKFAWTIPELAKKEGTGSTATYVGGRVEVEGGQGATWDLYRPSLYESYDLDMNDTTPDYGQRTHMDRRSWYPYTSYTMTKVTTKVWLGNPVGVGPTVTKSATVGKPPAPIVGAMAIDDETAECSVQLSIIQSSDPLAEVEDVSYEFQMYDSATKRTTKLTSGARKTNGTVTASLGDIHDIARGQYRSMQLTARQRGWGGKSGDVTTKRFYSHPLAPVVKSITMPTRTPGDRLTLVFEVPSSEQFPYTGVRLQTLANTDAETPEEAAATFGWSDTQIADTGKALSIPVDNILPDAGKKTWVRVKAWNQVEDILYTYSEPIRLETLETAPPSPSDDPITIISATTGADGRSADVLMAWDPDGTDDSDGTELTWSTDPDAWRSTKDPESFTFEWSDGQLTVDEVTYRGSANVRVVGLDEVTEYHFRARRYLGDEKGEWSNTMRMATSTTPTAVTLSAPTAIPTGAALPLSWGYSSASVQRRWEVHCEGRVVELGTDPLGAHSLPWERVEPLVTDGAVTLTVLVSTGGEAVESNAVTVLVEAAPEASVSVPASLTVQPVTFDVSCSTLSALTVVITARGANGENAAGNFTQAEGATVWSAVLSPAWIISQGGGYEATVTLPTIEGLIDGMGYRMTVVATADATGLRSGEASAEFTVDWARKAPLPTDATITTADEIGDDGMRERRAEIQLAAPEDTAEGDTVNVYRRTPDGLCRVASGVAPDGLVVDHYAPFGGTGIGYRLETVTTDGASAWWDYEYEFGTHGPTDRGEIRVDFGGTYVELERGVTIADTYEKDFEARLHADGTTAGYWGGGITHTAEGGTQVLRVVEAETLERVRQLARHTGPCFVRTSDGAAFEADVQVKGPSVEQATAGATVTVSITEVTPTDAFAAEVIEEAE